MFICLLQNKTLDPELGLILDFPLTLNAQFTDSVLLVTQTSTRSSCDTYMDENQNESKFHIIIKYLKRHLLKCASWLTEDVMYPDWCLVRLK